MKNQIFAMGFMAVLLTITTSTFAQTRFDKTHPRRDQVNDRLGNQNKRIHNEVKEGDLSKRQAANLHRDDKSIRNQERRMASRDNGHLTKKDQRILNKRENRNSRRIGQ